MLVLAGSVAAQTLDERVKPIVGEFKGSKTYEILGFGPRVIFSLHVELLFDCFTRHPKT